MEDRGIVGAGPPQGVVWHQGAPEHGPASHRRPRVADLGLVPADVDGGGVVRRGLGGEPAPIGAARVTTRGDDLRRSADEVLFEAIDGQRGHRPVGSESEIDPGLAQPLVARRRAEGVVVPMGQVDRIAPRVEGHHQIAVLDRDASRSVHRIVEDPGVGRQRRGRALADHPGPGDAVLHLLGRRRHDLHQRSDRRHRVLIDAEVPVEDRPGNRERRHGGAVVGEDDDAELLGRHHHQLGGHSVDPARMLDHLAAGVIEEEPAQPIAQEVRTGIEERRLRAHSHPHLGHEHLLVGGRREQGTTADGASVQVEPDPLRHVHHVRIDRTGRSDVVDLAVRDRHQLAVDFGVRSCYVRLPVQTAHRGGGARHPEREENSISEKVIPGPAGDGRDDLAGRQIHDVLIPEGGSNAPGRLMEAHPPEDLGP